MENSKFVVTRILIEPYGLSCIHMVSSEFLWISIYISMDSHGFQIQYSWQEYCNFFHVSSRKNYSSRVFSAFMFAYIAHVYIACRLSKLLADKSKRKYNALVTRFAHAAPRLSLP